MVLRGVYVVARGASGRPTVQHRLRTRHVRLQPVLHPQVLEAILRKHLGCTQAPRWESEGTMTEQQPTVIPVGRRTEVRMRYMVEGAPVATPAYALSKKFVPQQATVTFVDGVFDQLKLQGGVLKKDGTAGKEILECTYYHKQSANYPVPDWALPLCEPEATP